MAARTSPRAAGQSVAGDLVKVIVDKCFVAAIRVINLFDPSARIAGEDGDLIPLVRLAKEPVIIGIMHSRSVERVRGARVDAVIIMHASIDMMHLRRLAAVVLGVGDRLGHDAAAIPDMARVSKAVILFFIRQTRRQSAGTGKIGHLTELITAAKQRSIGHDFVGVGRSAEIKLPPAAQAIVFPAQTAIAVELEG